MSTANQVSLHGWRERPKGDSEVKKVPLSAGDGLWGEAR